MENKSYERFKALFPYIAKHAVSCRCVGHDEFVVELIDGDTILCDGFEKTFRRLPKDSSRMSEKECRREFGHRLYKIMMLKGVSQNELAFRTGISYVSISNYINGKISPSFYNVDKIAKALGCSTDDLRYI